jgi:site-specific recombinase XerD
LLARLLYGSGLRLMECLRLRVKDLEFKRRAIVVRDGKGEQDRVRSARRRAGGHRQAGQPHTLRQCEVSL